MLETQAAANIVMVLIFAIAGVALWITRRN